MIATLALFMAIGGGTALAAYVVTSNADIGPDTVAGHSPPAGAQSNLIAGSVNGQDVASNSLKGVHVDERTLTGGALRIAYRSSPTSAEAPKTTIVTVGGYALKARCVARADQNVEAEVYVNGPAGTVNFVGQRSDNDSGAVTVTHGESLPANVDKLIVVPAARPGDFFRFAGTMLLNTGLAGPVLVQIDFQMIADNRNGNEGCLILGTATRAT